MPAFRSDVRFQRSQTEAFYEPFLPPYVNAHDAINLEHLYVDVCIVIRDARDDARDADNIGRADDGVV